MAVAAVAAHSMALCSDGTVWTWGGTYMVINRAGNWGLARTAFTWTNVPVQTVGLTQMIGIAAGAVHCVALRSDGTVWTWVRIGRAIGRWDKHISAGAGTGR